MGTKWREMVCRGPVWDMTRRRAVARGMSLELRSRVQAIPGRRACARRIQTKMVKPMVSSWETLIASGRRATRLHEPPTSRTLVLQIPSAKQRRFQRSRRRHYQLSRQLRRQLRRQLNRRQHRQQHRRQHRQQHRRQHRRQLRRQHRHLRQR